VLPGQLWRFAEPAKVSAGAGKRSTAAPMRSKFLFCSKSTSMHAYLKVGGDETRQTRELTRSHRRGSCARDTERGVVVRGRASATRAARPAGMRLRALLCMVLAGERRASTALFPRDFFYTRRTCARFASEDAGGQTCHATSVSLEYTRSVDYLSLRCWDIAML
jgi:hypothetical protein